MGTDWPDDETDHREGQIRAALLLRDGTNPAFERRVRDAMAVLLAGGEWPAGGRAEKYPAEVRQHGFVVLNEASRRLDALVDLARAVLEWHRWREGEPLPASVARMPEAIRARAERSARAAR